MTEAVTPPNPAGAGGTKSRPDSIPDPTLLTIDALRREIAMLEGSMSMRLDAADVLTIEKFRRIDALLERAEEQRREQKTDTKNAVDAALASQKEATSKMEKSISEQIQSITTNLATVIGGVQTSISDLKDRVTIVESVRQGAVDQRSEARQVSAGMIALVGVGITILLATLTVIGFAMRTGT